MDAASVNQSLFNPDGNEHHHTLQPDDGENHRSVCVFDSRSPTDSQLPEIIIQCMSKDALKARHYRRFSFELYFASSFRLVDYKKTSKLHI